MKGQPIKISVGDLMFAEEISDESMGLWSWLELLGVEVEVQFELQKIVSQNQRTLLNCTEL